MRCPSLLQILTKQGALSLQAGADDGFHKIGESSAVFGVTSNILRFIRNVFLAIIDAVAVTVTAAATNGEKMAAAA